MLPWWFWALLWAVLILATLLCAVIAGWRLFKRGMNVMETLGEETSRLSAALAQPGSVVDYAPESRRYPHGTAATHGDPQEIRALRELGKDERIEARRVRRVARRTARGQAQNVYDLGLF